MSNDQFYESFVSKIVKLDDTVSVLGVNTNGCMPTRIYGLFVEAEFREVSNHLDESVWLKVITNPEFSIDSGVNAPLTVRNDVDFIAFGKVSEIDMVLAAIANASFAEEYDVTSPRPVTSYFSDAQIKADPDNTPDVQIENCQLHAKKTKSGFELEFTEMFDFSGERSAVCRLNGKLDTESLWNLVAVSDALKDWKQSVDAKLANGHSKEEEAEPSAPTF